MSTPETVELDVLTRDLDDTVLVVSRAAYNKIEVGEVFSIGADTFPEHEDYWGDYMVDGRIETQSDPLRAELILGRWMAALAESRAQLEQERPA